MVTQYGHADILTQPGLALSIDGGILASYKNQTLLLWNLKLGKLFRRIKTAGKRDSYTEWGTGMSSSPTLTQAIFLKDGRTLLTGCSNGTLQFWDILTGALIKELSDVDLDTVTSLALSSDERFLVAGGTNMVAWDLGTWTKVRTIRFVNDADLISAISVTSDYTIVAARKNSCETWNLNSGKIISRNFFDANEPCLNTISKDGKVLARGNQWNGSVSLWDTNSGEKKIEIVAHSEVLNCLTFSSDGKNLVTSKESGTNFWDVASGKCIREVDDLDSPLAMVLTNDDGMLVCADEFGNISTFDIRNGKTKLVNSFDSCPAISAIAKLPHTDSLIQGDTRGRLGFWDLSTGKRVPDYSFFDPLAFTADPERGRILEIKAPEEKKLLLVLSSSKLQILNYDGDKLAEAQNVEGIELTPDAETLAIVFGNHVVETWDLATFKKVSTFEILAAPLDMAYTTDGRSLIVQYDAAVSAYDARTGKQLWERTGILSSKKASRMALTKDGSCLIVASDSENATTFTLIDPGTGSIVTTIPTTKVLTTVKLCPETNEIIAGTDMGSLLFLSLDSRKQITIKGHDDTVTALDIIKPGNTIASTSLDGSIKLWDIASKKELASLLSDSEESWVVATEEGRFDCSDLEKITQFAWVMPEEPMSPRSPEIFFREFYEPNLLPRILRRETFPPIPEMSKLNLVTPKVKISSIKPLNEQAEIAQTDIASIEQLDDKGLEELEHKLELANTPEKGVEVEVTVESVSSEQNHELRESGVHHLRLFRDRRLIGVLPTIGQLDKSLVPKPNHPHTFKFLAKLPCDGSGRFDFEAFAFNSDRVRSEMTTKEYRVKIKQESKLGKAIVIAFGANDYRDPAQNLSYAAEDAKAYGQVLVPLLNKSGQFSKVSFLPLLSETDGGTRTATKEKLKELILSLVRRPSLEPTSKTTGAVHLEGVGDVDEVEPEDLVIIAFSCHGTIDRDTGEYYLLGSDFDKNSPDHSFESAISGKELASWLAGVDAKEVVLIIDSCHSGAASGQNYKGGPVDSPGLGQLAYYKRMKLLAASQANDVAREIGRLGHGLLSYALLVDALNADMRADLNRDGALTIDEWLSYAAGRVPKLLKDNHSADPGIKAFSVNQSDLGTKDLVQKPVFWNYSPNKSDWYVLNKSSNDDNP